MFYTLNEESELIKMEYITITGAKHQYGMEVFRVKQILYLEKDLTNEYDDEAIKVMSDSGVIYGYVANSVHTVARGTNSAGRIYDKFENQCKAEVCFITGNSIIAKLLDDVKKV